MKLDFEKITDNLVKEYIDSLQSLLDNDNKIIIIQLDEHINIDYNEKIDIIVINDV